MAVGFPKKREAHTAVEALVPYWFMATPSVDDLTDRYGAPQYPCDLIRVSTDGDQLAVHSWGRRHHLVDKTDTFLTPTCGKGLAWVAGTNPPDSGTLTGTAGDATTATFDAKLTAGQKYLLSITVAKSGATLSGTITPSLGGTAGAARSTAATFQEVITCGSSTTNLVLTAGAGASAFTGVVSAISIYPLTPPLSARAWEPMPCRKIVGVVQGSTIVTSSAAYAGWLARPR